MPKKPRILFVLDLEVSREKAGILARMVHSLKRFFDIDMVQHSKLTEMDVIHRLEKETYNLALVPLSKYMSWSRVEAFFGINRTDGPTFAGYLSEALPNTRLPLFEGSLRRIILDLRHLDPFEIYLLIHSLATDKNRTGLVPLLTPTAPIFFENWFNPQENGKRIERLLGLPEIQETVWKRRTSAIRIIENALWSLIFEERKGKREVHLTQKDPEPAAAFQVGIDPHCLLFRLFYRTFPRLTSQEVLHQFTPHAIRPTRPAQLLVRYADFVRVNTFIENGDIEITCALFRSGPSEKFPEQARSLWLDATSPSILSENPYGPFNSPRFKSLPDAVSIQRPDKSVMDSIRKILIQHKAKRDKAKRTDNPLDLPPGASQSTGSFPSRTPRLSTIDTETLLEAFQQRYFEARQQIRAFEFQIENLERKDGPTHEIKTLKIKMQALQNRQKHWNQRLNAMIESYRLETEKEEDEDEEEDS